jgi:hypothetical protein
MSGPSGDQAVRLSDDRPIAGPPDRPPIGGSWRTLYTSVILFLAVEIALFYLFTKAFE